MEEINRSGVEVLLVDDDEIVLNSLGSGLKLLGYRTRTSDSAITALEHYRQKTPDVVVLDYMMPEMNGVETARAMLKQTYRPIIMLSAHSETAMVREAIALGVAGYMVKPVEAEQLAPGLDAALARFQETRALIQHDANLQDGMEKNRIISTATGIVMERLGLPNDLAFERLRKLARDQRRPLREVAFELVDAITTANRMLHRPRK